MTVEMAYAYADMDMQDEGCVSSEAEILENVMLGNPTGPPYLQISPVDRRNPHLDSNNKGDERERQLPYEHSMSGERITQNPEEGNSPPIDDSLAPNQPFDQGASAGARVSTPIGIPQDRAARKLSREEKNLETKNNPGYGETGFDGNLPRIKRKILDVARQEFQVIVDQFNEEGDEFTRISDPLDPGIPKHSTAAIKEFKLPGN